MNILISQRQDKNKHGNIINILEENYIEYFEKLGITLIPIPNSTKDVEKYFKDFFIEGVILTGGNDVDPSFYGGEKTENLEIVPLRDKIEEDLIKIAIKKNIPVLGVCRGMQFINVFFKGRLSSIINHVSIDHSIQITENNFKKILGEEIYVNSYHNQGIFLKDLSPELKIFAQTKDNLIEGIYHPKYSLLGIQWHPERGNSTNLANDELITNFFKKKIFKTKKIKAIILAAGKGTRLGKYTQNLPKCMLEFFGKTLIERQVEILRACKIEDITIVKGYMGDKINIPGVKYAFNKNFDTTNMVESLFCVQEELEGEVIVCYADIIYERKVIKKVLEDNSEIGVVVDEDYWDYWTERLENPQEDVESLVVNQGKIVELGHPNCDLEKAKLRYVGIIKFSEKGIQNLKKAYFENKQEFFEKNEPWLRSKCFKQAYMTCILQELINRRHEIKPILIKRGWLEFDTERDYEKANLWKKEGSLKRFIDLG